MYTPPSPPSKAASSVCLPAEAVRSRCHRRSRRRSCWGRSYLSSWLASSVRSRDRREYMRMSFVIKAGNRPLNLSWGMHTVTVTVCAALWSLSYISTAPQIDTRREWRRNRVRHAIVQVEFIWEEACGTVTVMLNYVISEQLALFSSTRVVYLHRHKHSQMELASGVLNISPRYLGADIIC